MVGGSHKQGPSLLHDPKLLQNLIKSEKGARDAFDEWTSHSASAAETLETYALTCGSTDNHSVSDIIQTVTQGLAECSQAQHEYSHVLAHYRTMLKDLVERETDVRTILRDRDILVNRLAKLSVKRPTGEASRANHQAKLATAKAELAACESALRRDEGTLTSIKEAVLKEALQERFKGIAALASVWSESASAALDALQGLSSSSLTTNLQQQPQKLFSSNMSASSLSTAGIASNHHSSPDLQPSIPPPHVWNKMPDADAPLIPESTAFHSPTYDVHDQQAYLKPQQQQRPGPDQFRQNASSPQPSSITQVPMPGGITSPTLSIPTAKPLPSKPSMQHQEQSYVQSTASLHPTASTSANQMQGRDEYVQDHREQDELQQEESSDDDMYGPNIVAHEGGGVRLLSGGSYKDNNRNDNSADFGSQQRTDNQPKQVRSSSQRQKRRSTSQKRRSQTTASSVETPSLQQQQPTSLKKYNSLTTRNPRSRVVSDSAAPTSSSLNRRHTILGMSSTQQQQQQQQQQKTLQLPMPNYYLPTASQQSNLEERQQQEQQELQQEKQYESSQAQKPKSSIFRKSSKNNRLTNKIGDGYESDNDANRDRDLNRRRSIFGATTVEKDAGTWNTRTNKYLHRSGASSDEEANAGASSSEDEGNLVAHYNDVSGLLGTKKKSPEPIQIPPVSSTQGKSPTTSVTTPSSAIYSSAPDHPSGNLNNRHSSFGSRIRRLSTRKSHDTVPSASAATSAPMLVQEQEGRKDPNATAQQEASRHVSKPSQDTFATSNSANSKKSGGVGFLKFLSRSKSKRRVGDSQDNVESSKGESSIPPNSVKFPVSTLNTTTQRPPAKLRKRRTKSDNIYPLPQQNPAEQQQDMQISDPVPISPSVLYPDYRKPSTRPIVTHPIEQAQAQAQAQKRRSASEPPGERDFVGGLFKKRQSKIGDGVDVNRNRYDGEAEVTEPTGPGNLDEATDSNRGMNHTKTNLISGSNEIPMVPQDDSLSSSVASTTTSSDPGYPSRSYLNDNTGLAENINDQAADYNHVKRLSPVEETTDGYVSEGGDTIYEDAVALSSRNSHSDDSDGTIEGPQHSQVENATPTTAYATGTRPDDTFKQTLSNGQDISVGQNIPAAQKSQQESLTRPMIDTSKITQPKVNKPTPPPDWKPGNTSQFIEVFDEDDQAPTPTKMATSDSLSYTASPIDKIRQDDLIPQQKGSDNTKSYSNIAAEHPSKNFAHEVGLQPIPLKATTSQDGNLSSRRSQATDSNDTLVLSKVPRSALNRQDSRSPSSSITARAKTVRMAPDSKPEIDTNINTGNTYGHVSWSLLSPKSPDDSRRQATNEWAMRNNTFDPSSDEEEQFNEYASARKAMNRASSKLSPTLKSKSKKKKSAAGNHHQQQSMAPSASPLTKKRSKGKKRI